MLVYFKLHSKTRQQEDSKLTYRIVQNCGGKKPLVANLAD